MPAASKKGDVSTGHNPCFPSTAAVEGSPNVIINGQPALRVGDGFAAHSCGNTTHTVDDRRVSAGSAVVKTNLKPAARIGDRIACGDEVAQGSANVVMGNSPYPVFVVLEPGLMLIGGAKVYDDSKEGHAAKKRDETYVANDHETGESVSPSGSNPVSIPTAAPVSTAPLEIMDLTPEMMGKSVSKYFTLADAGMLIADQPDIGLTAQQIANNWKNLCVNVLDPLYEKYRFKGDKGKVNSGFRTVKYNRSIGSSDTSDHCKGCAADISLGSATANVDLFKYIIESGLPFSQVIYEGRWVHIAFGGKPQSITRVMYTRNGKAPYTHCGQHGEDLPANWAG